MHLPPTVALFLTICGIFWLFRRDFGQKPNVTNALWLPLIWMFLIMSRLPSQWLNTLGIPIMGRSMEEGNPFDAAVYFAVIAAGFYVLVQRGVTLGEVLRNNRWVAVYFVFCFVAISWSDFPFVAFKRWIKILGHPIMVLVVLTEPEPQEALSRLMKRTAYVILPISIVLIKYFEDVGRSFDQWSGEPVNVGITLDKNALGYDCLVLGFFLIWHLMKLWSTRRRGGLDRKELWFSLGFLYMVWWLLSAAHSSTSLVSLVVGVLMMVFLGLPFVDRRKVGAYLLILVSLAVIAELAFGLSGQVIALLGKDPTLTGRKKLWPELLALSGNPVFGTGFESYWLGDRLKVLWDKYWWHPNEAHNGYLEIYLNLGIAGLLVLFGLFVSTFNRSRHELLRDFDFGRFRLGFFAAVIVYNWTESAFKGLHPVWFVFYLICIESPLHRSPVEPQLQADELSDKSLGFAPAQGEA